MIDPKKVYMMSKLASYEKKQGKKDFKMHQYRRKTYLCWKSIQTVCAITCAYLFGALIYMMQFYSEIMKHGFAYQYQKNVIYLGTGYILTVIVALVATNLYYRRQYNDMLLRVRDYDQRLGRLDQYILQQEQNKPSVTVFKTEEND